MDVVEAAGTATGKAYRILWKEPVLRPSEQYPAKIITTDGGNSGPALFDNLIGNAIKYGADGSGSGENPGMMMW